MDGGDVQTIEAEINKLPPRMKEILNAVYINGAELPRNGRKTRYLRRYGENLFSNCPETYPERVFHLTYFRFQEKVTSFRLFIQILKIFS